MTVQTDFTKVLLKKHLPAARKIERIKEVVDDQFDFDQLFNILFHHKKPLVQRAANAVDKITILHPEYLEPHREQLLSVLKSPDHKELKRYSIKFISRIDLPIHELRMVWNLLIHFTVNPHEHKAIRLNALQTLNDFSKRYVHLTVDFLTVLKQLVSDPLPWMQAKILKLTTAK